MITTTTPTPCADYGPYNHTASLTVNTPTISGFFSNNAFWNLGPGSPDPAPTTGGIYYYQSVALTFNTNCNVGDTCSDTPQWSLASATNQTTLGTAGGSTVTTASGSSVTISKGSSYGSCTYASTLSASMGGFSTAPYSIEVDSPANAVSTTNVSEPDSNGYVTYWRFKVVDACGVNNMLPVQMSENFPAAFSASNGSSGYGVPPIVNFELADWPDNYEFIDNVGQSGTGQSPAVFHDSTSPYGPTYSANTLYFSGAHTINAGSDTTGDGIPVYSGTIEYYADHGDNTP